MSRHERTLLFGVFMFATGANASNAVFAESRGGLVLALLLAALALVLAGVHLMRLDAS